MGPIPPGTAGGWSSAAGAGSVGSRMDPVDRASRLPPERERELVALARTDATAYGALYDFYLPRIFGYVQRRTGDRAVSEDLTAATFEKGLLALRSDGFRNEAFGGWLYRVAANAVIDHARRARRIVPLEGPAGSGAVASDRPGDGGGLPGDERAADALAAALDREDLRAALARIGPLHRRVLVLRYLDDLGPDEICALLGCSRATLAVRLHRALRALRDALATESSDAA